ncbi:HTH_Tnp_Tc3_2 domain-containing protein [Trichonephila clavipes]|uniref:HTH_Tnp_Tc3_2 domain-containing protein n=1 Tax=Trichonephila clavipes TaxID=2585209 RepID=A0A8X6S390_TRICX|nr:HTH_Tnp_Tc3_2 domain-containing protein [Trichonephila clavipes]
MPRVRSRNAYQHVSDFYKDQIVEYRDCGLSYHSNAVRVGRDPLTVGRIWTRWVQDGNTERRAGSKRSPITRSRKDRHVTRMTLMDRATTSLALSQESGSFAGQQASPGTIRRRLQGNKCLQEQLDDVFCSMDSQLKDLDCGYL